MKCPECGAGKQRKRGIQVVDGVLSHRYSCTKCPARYNVPCDEETLTVIAAKTKNTGWGKADVVTEEAKKGNIP